MTRSQVHVSTQHHHIFNVQIQPDLRSPLVQINLRNNGITFSGVGMLDSGCTTCIIPISRLPEDARRHISKTNIRVKGIGGNISILGKLTCDITLGDDTSPAFCNVDTLITTSDIPILIGQNILGHHTLLSYTIDNQKATVELARTLPSGKLKHTVPLSTTVHPRIKPTHNLSHGTLTVSNEADHKMEAKLNRSIFKDPIQVDDKVLLHRPQSATAHLSHLPWIGDFEVTKTNGLVVQVKNDNCETHWVHRGHVRRLVPRPNDLQHMHRPPPPPALSPPHQIPNHPSTRPLLSPCPPRHPLSQLPTLSSGEHLVANDCSSGDNTQNPTKRTTRGQLPARFKDFVMCQKTK